MAENFLTNNQPEIEAPRDLMSKIMSRVEQEIKLRALRRRLILMLASFVPLLAGLTPIWQNFWSDWQQAGLVDYLSLLMSDAKIVLANWQNFSLGFLEIFPVVSTVAVLGLILATLVVARLSLKYGQEFLSYKYKLQKI